MQHPSDPEEGKIKISVPTEGVALGDKNISDLQEDISLDGNKVLGISKYVENFTAFNESNAKEQKGNYLLLQFDEAIGKPDGTVKFLLKGSDVNQKKAKSVDPKDGRILLLIHNNNNEIEITQDEKETRTLTLADLIMLKPTNEVVKPNEGAHETYNTTVENLQQDIAISSDGKVTGILKYITNYQNSSEHKEGNFIHLHINHENLPSENVKFGFEGSLLEPDKDDWNYVMFVDNDRKSKKIQLEVDDKVLYTLDLTELELKAKEN